MSFVHYLFLGHFDRVGDAVRFAKDPQDGTYRPVIRSALDAESIVTTLREVKGSEVEGVDFPDDWTVWSEGGYLVCDKYTRNAEVIDFIDRLVRQTRCDMYDAAAHSDITLREWLESSRCHAKL
jgi:hypothetical protein